MNGPDAGGHPPTPYFAQVGYYRPGPARGRASPQPGSAERPLIMRTHGLLG